MAEIKLDRVIAPAFYGLHQDIRSEGHTHYVLKGGRGSTKSSFTSIEIILGIMQHPDAHAVILRKVGNTLHDSVLRRCSGRFKPSACRNTSGPTKAPFG